MKKILLRVDYRDNTGKFWFESYLKNKIVSYDPEKMTIHEVVKQECDEEGMELTYKGKPKGNIYRDGVGDGNSRIVGYLYRGKSEVHDRSMPRAVMVYWDVWVEIQSVEQFEFVEI